MPRKFTPRPLLENPDDPSTLLVPLTKGLFAVIDREDAGLVAPYLWHATRMGKTERTWYAARSPRDGDTRAVIGLHHQIIDRGENYCIDHADGNGLNNRRSNLRPATHSQNNANRAPRGGKRFKGVRWSWAGTWHAYMSINRRYIFLGAYETEEDAARAVDAKAREVYGEFARLNLPPSDAPPPKRTDPYRPQPTGKWSRRYDHCTECGTVKTKHAARGLCAICYQRNSRRRHRP